METFYYAQISQDGICIAVTQAAGEIDLDSMIRIDSFDMLCLDKLWTGSEWIDPPPQ